MAPPGSLWGGQNPRVQCACCIDMDARVCLSVRAMCRLFDLRGRGSKTVEIAHKASLARKQGKQLNSWCGVEVERSVQLP